MVGAVIGGLRGQDKVVQCAGWDQNSGPPADPNAVRAMLAHHGVGAPEPHDIPGGASQQYCHAGAGHAGKKPAQNAQEGERLCQIGGDDPLVM
ncbi:hypothetical protein [Tateyamaria sp. SN6-1]|uniref:hypothetical protein n=1 Tax=Tateyamaria sp. SN6-1 TaxID=3092148 RepID=UPI0039F5FF9A